METFFGRYKNVLVLLIVLLAQFIALAIQVRTHAVSNADGKGVRLIRYGITAMMAPPEKAMVHTGSGVRGFWDDYVNLRHARTENEALRDEVSRLRLEQASLLQDALQGQRLQALLGFQEHYIAKTVPAQVIGTGGSDQSRILYIDKGSRDGLAVDQPVITPDGIVGKVKDVFPHTAQILAINDQTSGAGVVLEKTRLRGVLRGNAFGQPQIIDILPDERIKPGEHVITSGGDQIYPRGLAVGVVEKVVADPEREPYVDIVIKPAANLSHLEEVLIVTGTSDTLPPKAQRDLARSQAVGAVEAEKQRASDVLAEKLPGLDDPNATPDEQLAEQTAAAKAAGGEEPGRPIKPLTPLHPDRFSPGTVPSAAQMTPGRAPVVISAARSQELAQAGAVATPKPHPHTAVEAAGGGTAHRGLPTTEPVVTAKPAASGANAKGGDTSVAPHPVASKTASAHRTPTAATEAAGSVVIPNTATSPHTPYIEPKNVEHTGEPAPPREPQN
ncbi:MAG: rod shape-determining protein MreC [Acidobacteriaceae bacterium]